MKTVFIILTLALAIVGAYILYSGSFYGGANIKNYSSEKLGISFGYPGYYFIQEHDESTGERARFSLVLAEDTEENRDVFEGRSPSREGPPTITVGIFQNNLDNYTAQEWINGTSFSNFKLSDGVLSKTAVNNEPALKYRATGLYENENVVIARHNYVYMFTVFYLSPEDKILKDFDVLLESIRF